MASRLSISSGAACGRLRVSGFQGSGHSTCGRVDLLEQHVARQIEIDRARLARHRAAERLVQELREALGVMRARRPFGAGLHHRQLVHVLERAAAPGADRRAAAERDDRDAVGPGVRDPGDQVGHGRPRGGHAHARAQAQARVGVRHHRRGLLVAHVDAAQAALQRLRLDHEHRRAHDEEEHVDALALERLGENLRTVHCCLRLQPLWRRRAVAATDARRPTRIGFADLTLPLAPP